MKKKDVQVGGTYAAKIGGQVVPVRLDAESRFGGWDATNLLTKRRVRVKSAAKLRHAWRTAEAAERQTTAMTGSDAPCLPAGSSTREASVAAGLDAKPCTHCKGEGRFPRCSICGRTVPAGRQAVKPRASDGPPQDVDERIAAAPPSIVPYEQRRARAEAANARMAAASDAIDEPQYDPDRCATKRCRGTPAITHLGRPLCQACWERHCNEDQSPEVTDSSSDACRPTENVEPQNEENAMSKKQTKTKAKTTKEPKQKRVSALDAAATILKKARKPMNAQELIAAMAEQGLWTSPGGKTPHATLYAAMMREERDKGRESRFRKVDRGQFTFNGKGA